MIDGKLQLKHAPADKEGDISKIEKLRSVPVGGANPLLESSIKSPYKQPELVSTLIYIAVGHPQQAPLWWKIAAARFLYSTEVL